MKKIFSLLLTLVFIATLGLSIFAADDMEIDPEVKSSTEPRVELGSDYDDTLIAAAPVVPSIEAKPGPGVIPSVDDDGNLHDAILIDVNGKREGVDIDGTTQISLVITPVSEADSTPYSEVSALLYSAYRQLTEAKTIPALSKGVSDYITELKIKGNLNFKDEDLLAIHLVDVSLVKDGKVIPVPAGSKVSITFNLGIDYKKLLLVLHNTAGSDWEAISDIVSNPDGSVTVTFTHLSPVAFVVERTGSLPVDPDGPDSPQTGVEFNALYAVAAVAFVALSVVFFVKAKKCKD